MKSFQNTSWVKLVCDGSSFKYEPVPVTHDFLARTRPVTIQIQKSAVDIVKNLQQELKRRHEQHKQTSVISIHNIKYVWCDETNIGFLVRSNVN